MYLLTISVKNTRPLVVKMTKNSGFHGKYISNLQKPYPFEFGGGWGLLVFHKNFLVHSHNEVKAMSLHVSDLYRVD